MELTEFDCNDCHHDGAFAHHRSSPTNPFTMQPWCIADTADTGAKAMDDAWLQRRPFGGATGSRKTQQSSTVPMSTNHRRLLLHQCNTSAAKCSLLSLPQSLLELEWTTDGEKKAWCGWNLPPKDAMVVKPLCFV